MQVCEFCKETVIFGDTQYFIRKEEYPEELLRVCHECFKIAGISNSVQSKVPLIEKPPKYERIICKRKKPLKLNLKGFNPMKPATMEEIKNLERDFNEFCSLGNTELKALYLAMSGRGFTNIIRSSKDTIQCLRDSDKKFVVCSYPISETKTITVEKVIRRVRFHTDDSKLEFSKVTF